MSISIALRALVSATAMVCTTAAMAQEYPTRAVRLIVGFAPGGSNDLIGRAVATRLSDRLGKQVLVDNRAGASGIVASEIVAASPPDGYTLMVVSIAHTANPYLYKLKYDTAKGFTPIAQLAAGASVFAVHPDVPARTLKEFIDHVRKNPGKLNLAHAGVGTFQHMASTMLLSMAKLDMLPVSFKGGGPATIDVVAGNTQAATFSIVQVTGHLKSGRMRALGVGSAKRLDQFPDIPAIAETLPGYEADNWWGVVGPAGVPDAIVQRLATEISAVQATPELMTVLEREGAYPIKRSGADFGRYLSSEMAKWEVVIRDGNIKVE